MNVFDKILFAQGMMGFALMPIGVIMLAFARGQFHVAGYSISVLWGAIAELLCGLSMVVLSDYYLED